MLVGTAVFVAVGTVPSVLPMAIATRTGVGIDVAVGVFVAVLVATGTPVNVGVAVGIGVFVGAVVAVKVGVGAWVATAYCSMGMGVCGTLTPAARAMGVGCGQQVRAHDPLMHAMIKSQSADDRKLSQFTSALCSHWIPVSDTHFR